MTSPYLNRPLRTFEEVERALIAEIEARGYVIAPKHPTAAMIEEGMHSGHGMANAYRAMLAAAPPVTE